MSRQLNFPKATGTVKTSAALAGISMDYLSPKRSRREVQQSPQKTPPALDFGQVGQYHVPFFWCVISDYSGLIYK
jgi:hypothetical protein